MRGDKKGAPVYSVGLFLGDKEKHHLRRNDPAEVVLSQGHQASLSLCVSPKCRGPRADADGDGHSGWC